MLISYAWRLRAGEQLFGPAARIEQLYGAVKYMPNSAMWEWKDANGDWHEHITVGRWRENLRKIRWLYNTDEEDTTEDKGEAPADNLSLKISIETEYIPKMIEANKERGRIHGHKQRERGIWMTARVAPKGWDPFRKRWSPRFLKENPDFEPWDVEAYNNKMVEEAKKKREKYNEQKRNETGDKL